MTLPRKRRKTKTAEHRAFHNRVASMNCLACGYYPSEIHHLTSDGFQRITRNHEKVLPLCEKHHRTGKDAIHAIGQTAFGELFELDLIAEAAKLWSEHNA